MMVKKFQVQRLFLGVKWVNVGYQHISEASAREEARKVSGTTRVVSVWVE